MIKQCGISLVELIVSLCLVSLILTLVTQLYVKTKQNYMTINALLEENFDLQMVGDLVRDSIRQAGFTPCLSIHWLRSLDSRNGRTGLAGLDTREGNTLAINRMSEHFSLVLQQISPIQLLLNPVVRFSAQQTVLIADCYHAEVHQILAVQKTKTGTIIKLTKALRFNFLAPIYLGEWLEEKFFIQKNQRGELALFYRQNHAEELSSRVKQLSIESQGKLIALKLTLDQAEPLVIETEVRAQ